MKQWTFIILILFWLAWHLAVPVDLARSDLGRHIKNGELILQGNWDVLYKNYYSYTNPEYPFLNYHWLFGVFCYAVWHYVGFTGLSFIYLILELSTFYVFFRCCQRYSSFAIACAFGLLAFPFITFRSEVRPEGISYLFCGLFWWLIDSYRHKRVKTNHLIIGLCVLQVIWVNTHIFFMMGPLLTAIFWWQARTDRDANQAKVLQNLFFLLLGMCLINPFGINVFLLLLDTWKKASFFPIIESLSVPYVLKSGMMAYRPVLLYFLATLTILGVSFFYMIRRDGLKKYMFIASLGMLLAFAAMKSIRMIGLFGYFGIPLSAFVYSSLTKAGTVQFKKNLEIVLVATGIIISASISFNWDQRHAIGIVSGSNDAAEFFKREKITGVIFNNYGLGGYLIFHLSPQHRLFIDNRGAAAFPEDFIDKTYVQMQMDDNIWHKLDQQYHFNVIFYTPEQSDWGIKFLANRLVDHHWALVFQNKEARIFLKRNLQNTAIIRRHEIHVPVKDAESFYGRGIAYAKQNNFTEALSDFNKAIEIDPNYADAYNNRGFIYGIQGHLVQALSDFNKAIEINSNDADAYNNRAFAYYQSKEYKKAWADVHKAEDLGGVVKPEFINALDQVSGKSQ